MPEPIWYLIANIKPVEDETVLVYDGGAHYMAHWLVEEWWDEEERHLTFSPEAYWTDLPVPTPFSTCEGGDAA